MPIGAAFLVDGYVVACGEVANLSKGGACLDTVSDLRVGDAVEVRLEDGWEPDPLLVPARVVWSRRQADPQEGSRCGVRWSRPIEPFRRRFERMMD